MSNIIFSSVDSQLLIIRKNTIILSLNFKNKYKNNYIHKFKLINCFWRLGFRNTIKHLLSINEKTFSISNVGHFCL